ncbi:MAG: prepilin-type N-terminal cleavage/methylation domain-containing protein [Peptococcaceae bacterium]|nr:prepilin-type N-terminal cleavage/methylation domain-containing protein [Peptococcaceae bacterium]
MRRDKENGFTLLEVMIAVGLFSILMFSIAQMMRAEIGLFNSENNTNQNEQKARTALNHVLDEIRLYGYVTYIGDGGNDDGFYSQDPEGTKCLVNLNPSSANQSLAELYYLPDKDELWYNDLAHARTYLVTDHITTLEIQGVTAHLARIRVVAGEPASDSSFELVTWGRLY